MGEMSGKTIEQYITHFPLQIKLSDFGNNKTKKITSATKHLRPNHCIILEMQLAAKMVHNFQWELTIENYITRFPLQIKLSDFGNNKTKKITSTSKLW